jgi:hypothetical protein
MKKAGLEVRFSARFWLADVFCAPPTKEKITGIQYAAAEGCLLGERRSEPGESWRRGLSSVQLTGLAVDALH